MLPWDPAMSILYTSRFKVVDKKDQIVPVNGGSKQLDSYVYDELSGNMLPRTSRMR